MSISGSRFREHARQVRDRGGRERRNWNPSNDAAHYRLYRQWQQITGKRPVVENFCHYWKVVVLWAPLALLGQRVGHAYESKRVRVMTLVVISVLLALELVLVSLVGIIFWVFEEKGLGKKLGYFLFELHPPKLWWLRPWLVFPAFAAAMAPFSRVALIAAIAMLGIVALGGLLLLMSWGVDVYRRHLAVQGDNQKQTALALQRERTEFLLRGVHARIHPKQRHSEWRFQCWLARYVRFMLRQMPHLTNEKFWTLSIYWHYAQHRMWDWVDLENIKGTISQHQAPGRQSSLRVLGDFFALVWAVVVACKWKICPIVTIEQEVIAPSTTG